MKWQWILVCGLLLAGGLAYAQNTQNAPANKPGAPETVQDQASYGIGLSIGRNLESEGLKLNAELLVQGIRDGLSGQAPLLTDEQLEKAMFAFQRQVQAEAEARLKEAGAANQKEGEQFLAANKAKQGVVTLPSGLQYKVLQAGDGPSPKLTDTVKTHYHGTLIDGTVFDSSVERGEPVTFPVGGVIKGWTEALQKMQVGDKWQLFVPSDLAYGEQGAGQGAIAPHAVLIFEVELLGIE